MFVTFHAIADMEVVRQGPEPLAFGEELKAETGIPRNSPSTDLDAQLLWR